MLQTPFVFFKLIKSESNIVLFIITQVLCFEKFIHIKIGAGPLKLG